MKCTDKIAYETRGEAYDFAKSIRKNPKRKRSTFIYQCQYCGKWHLTHRRPERFSSKLMQRNKYDFKKMSE